MGSTVGLYICYGLKIRILLLEFKKSKGNNLIYYFSKVNGKRLSKLGYVCKTNTFYSNLCLKYNCRNF